MCHFEPFNVQLITFLVAPFGYMHEPRTKVNLCVYHTHLQYVISFILYEKPQAFETWV